jgi:hypothetical protein
MPELASRNHPVPSTYASCACSSPRSARNAYRRAGMRGVRLAVVVYRVEVVRAPAEQESVQDHNEGGEARHLGTMWDREHHLIFAWPIRTKGGSGKGESTIVGRKKGGRNWFGCVPVELGPAVPIPICFAYLCQLHAECRMHPSGAETRVFCTRRHFFLFDTRCRMWKRIHQLRPRRGGMPRRHHIAATTSLHSCSPSPAHMRVEGKGEGEGRAL